MHSNRLIRQIGKNLVSVSQQLMTGAFYPIPSVLLTREGELSPGKPHVPRACLPRPNPLTPVSTLLRLVRDVSHSNKHSFSHLMRVGLMNAV